MSAPEHQNPGSPARPPAAPAGVDAAQRGRDDAAWDAFVDAHPLGTLFHRTPWRDLVTGEFRFVAHYLRFAQGGRIRGVLPLFVVPQPLFRRCLISVPYAVYGGLLADGDDAARALLDEARARLREHDGLYLELRHREHRGLEPLPGTDLYVTYVRDLPATPEACLGVLPRKARAAARQARERHGLEGVATRDLIDGFHRLFLVNKRRLGSPAFAPTFFRRALALHGAQAGLFNVIQEGRTVSAVLYFTYRDTILPYFSGAVPEAESVHANNFMYMALMEHAVRLGLKRFDFGRSRRDTGSARFKENQGFRATELPYRYLLHRAAAVPANNPSNPRYDRVKRLWARAPLWLTRRLGPRLIRYFP
ncbi:MAG: FemAB family PEP-CTERM system-associated protein [Planctomycetes bacterium]|nr:FemAB family PEP-CTERM system-associated protein [Planctomycetota bacterium]